MHDQTAEDTISPAPTGELPAGYRPAADGGIEFEISLRWGDMDINNHINNVQFARLFEEGRVRAFSAWFGEVRPLPILVARQDIEFRAPLDYSVEPVTMTVAITRIGTSSFTVGATLRAPSGTLTAVAATSMVAVDPATGRSIPIPDGPKAVMRRWQGTRPAFHGEG